MLGETDNLSHETFKSKINSEHCLSIRKNIKEFYIDFQQKYREDFFNNPEDQSKYLRDFINNTSRAIIEHPLWINCDKAEQENAITETEKFITKAFFEFTFGPSDDQGRDTLLSRNILMHSWVEPRHFNLPEFNFSIFESAVNELCKMNLYRFYIDKVVCLANCMRLIEYNYKSNVINEELDEETFIKLLIYVILKTNPNRLFSNVRYILRYINPNYYSINIYKTTIETICKALTRLEKLAQDDFIITSEEYDAKIVEMTKIANEAFEKLAQNQEWFDEITRENSTNSIIQSFLRIRLNNEDDMEYQGLFSHLDSIRSNSINRNGSSFSDRSSLIMNEYDEYREDYYKEHMNEPMTKPFSTNLSEEERVVLDAVDQEIKKSLSIG